jgi:hypothetical protein
MRRYLPLLAVICFWLIAGENDGTPSTAESKSRCEVTYNGRSIEITSTEIGCQSNVLLTSTLGEHLIQLIHANSTVIDVSAGFGASYMPLAQLLGDTGTIIAIEKSQELFDMLQRNAVKGEAWSRTLLLNGDPSKIRAGDNAHSITSIVNKLALGCPHLLRFNHHNDVARYETYTALLGAYGVLEHCLPVLLIDCDKTDIAGCIATVELLSAVESARGQSYELFWRTLETRWAYTTDGKHQEHTDTRAALLALPLGHRAANTLRTWSSVQPVHLRDRDRFDPMLPTLWEEVAAKLSTTTPVVTGLDGRARQTVTVELTDITAWNSTLYRGLGHYNVDVSSTELRTQLAVLSLREASLHRRVVTYDYAPSDTAETLELVASAYCFLWGSAVHRQLTKTQKDGSAEESAQAFARWQQELGPVQAACAAFLGKRLRTLHRILTMRTEQQRQDSSMPTAVDASGTVVSDEEASASATPYAYYELNAHNATAGSLQWFERPPLTAQHDESLCMEPVWCSHTVEFQRRIRAWQFPEEPTTPLAEHVQFSKRLRAQQQHQQQQGGGTDGGSQEEDQPRRRDWSVRANASTVGSCGASKFLVYEPPSHAHGLGSMLELIASTFRYAICLDRILILNAFNQSGTLTKWIHPGCQGSFVECYFEPLSGCHLTEDDINRAFVSKDGDRFELFPLRDERVLVLTGMPLVGSCSLCHSEWRVESKFFDGLFMGDSGFDPSVALLHMPAFRSAVKQPWASQFLRYLLRPRPWVQEAITQLTQISMRSPAIVASTSNSITELPLHAFPKRFLSLHVRFGMKAAEADLQPLSKYMDFIARKLPEMRDIFVSTETDAVIQTLISYVTLSMVVFLTIAAP